MSCYNTKVGWLGAATGAAVANVGAIIDVVGGVVATGVVDAATGATEGVVAAKGVAVRICSGPATRWGQ